MKKIIYFLVFIVSLLNCHAQVYYPPQIITSPSAPSGACSANLPIRLVTPSGTLYSCQSGTWGQIAGGGGGSGTVTSVVDGSGLFSVATPTTVPTFTYAAVPANTILAGPASGGNAAPFFRALGASDLPSTTLSAAGTPTTNTITKWVTSNTIGNVTPTDMATALTAVAATPLQSAVFDKSSGAYIPSGGIKSSGLVGLYVFDAADVTAGTTLFDHSGNGNNGTIATGTNAPSFTNDSGMTVLRWPISNISNTNIVDFPGISSPVTIQVLAKLDQPNTFNTSYTRTLFGYSQTPGFQYYEFNPVLGYANSNRYELGFLPVSNFGTTLPTGNGYNLYTLVISATANQYYLNDQQGYSINGVAALTPPTGGHFVLGTGCGASCFVNNVLFGANVAFVAIYNTALSQSDILGNYRAIRSRIEPSGTVLGSPAYNQTNLVPNNIVCDTTSIDAGTGGGSAPCGLMTLGANYTVNVAAIPSVTIQGKLKTGLATEKFFLNPNVNNVLILGGPVTNDLCGSSGALSTPTPAQAWGYTAQTVAAAKAAGFNQVIIGTMISRTGNGVAPNNASTCDQLKNVWNVFARQNASSVGASLMDSAASIGLGADGAYNNPTNACGGSACFVADHIHPTVAGETVYAALEQASILAATSPYTSAQPNSQAGTAYSMSSADRYVLAPVTAAAAWNLPDCLGPTGSDYNILNTSSSFAITMSPLAGETITGPNVIPPNGVAKFTIQLTGPTTGGCYWTSQITQSSSGSFTAANDLSGNSSSQTVIGINSTNLAALATGALKITTGTGVPSTLPLQGTDTNVMTSGTVSGGAGAGVCLDANAGLTTTGCTSGTVSSVFTRTGNVTAASGDYTAAQVTNAASTVAANSFSGTQTITTNGALSQAAQTLTGTPITGGTATTNFPYIYYNCSGSTARTDFNTSGEIFSFNACSGYAGRLMSLDINNSLKFGIDSSGNTSLLQIQNLITSNNSSVTMFNGGTTIGRNVADASTAVTSRQQNASSTGHIHDFTKGAAVVSFIGTAGDLNAPTLVSTVATGTAPLAVTSTTPVANMVVAKHPTVQYCGITGTCSATAQTNGQIVFGSAVLNGGTPATVTISGISPAFADTAYICTVTSKSNPSATTTLFSVNNITTSSFQIIGTTASTDTVGYICVH